MAIIENQITRLKGKDFFVHLFFDTKKDLKIFHLTHIYKQFSEKISRKRPDFQNTNPWPSNLEHFIHPWKRCSLISSYLARTLIRSSTCALTGFFWLLSHVIYLKLTKVLKECFLSQTEWWVVKVLFLSLRPEVWTFWRLNFVNRLRFTSHQKKVKKLFTY